MSQTTHASSPTPKQIRFIKSLAEQKGTSFSYPKTRGQASSEIKRLLALKKSGRGPARSASEATPAQMYGTAPRPREVYGYGSTASWRKPTHKPSGRTATLAAGGRVGQLTELGRYRISDGERVVYGQRINGTVRITDRPAEGRGRCYLVERELEHDGYEALKALVADYTLQARQLDAIPMASSIVRRDLQQPQS